MPGADGVLAGRYLDLEARSFGHERAIEEPPGLRLARVAGRPERGGTLAQGDVDAFAPPRRLRDREGLGHEALGADP